MNEVLTEKVIVLGVDGMDPRITNYFMAQGKMPNVQQFVKRGAARKDLALLGAMPTVTPPQWTTLATGAYPMTHGITCFFNQHPTKLDTMIYNLDSRLCQAEPLWNVLAEAGKKTLVWHWPGSSWPPTSDNPNLHVVEGTQPGSVNMGVAGIDWEKVLLASEDITEVGYIPHTANPAGTGCIITDLEDTVAKADGSGGTISGAEASQLVFGNAAREAEDGIHLINMSEEETEVKIMGHVSFDLINSPIKLADHRVWANAPEKAKEFTVFTSSGLVRRPCLILCNEQGFYDRIAIYKSKKEMNPLVTVRVGEMISNLLDEIKTEAGTKKACRSVKLFELAPDGSRLRLWISNAMDIANDSLWSPKSIYTDITAHVGHVPAVSLVGGFDPILAKEILLPSWDVYDKWQADCLNYLAQNNGYDVIYSHMHSVDAIGHQLWHYGKNQPSWPEKDEVFYQSCIEYAYQQADNYLGEFLPLLDEGWSVLIVSDHGLIVSENEPPVLGESGGVNVPVMRELGYTVMMKDADGNDLREVDWSKTRALNVRADHIWINLKGRDAHGIVDPADQYELEEQIISDLYNYRDTRTGRRIVSVALRNKDAILLGMGGPECGDIIFFMNEGFNRIHGDSLSTQNGYFHTSVSPIFIAAGKGFKESFTTERVIRQVDVAPTIALMMGVRMPKQCEGAPIYQILV